MYTRCPQCKNVTRLQAELLSRALGLVKCGQCDRVFNALAYLFDDWPSGKAWKPAAGEVVPPPVVGAENGRRGYRPPPEKEEPAETQEGKRGIAWAVLAAALSLVTVANAAWTFREPLGSHPRIGVWMTRAGWLQPVKDGLPSEPEQIQLVSRDVHSHPTRSGILVLSFTFVNLAEDRQEYPRVQVTLLDPSNQPIAQRRFMPSDYLNESADVTSGLAPDVYLPVLLELVDPSERAVGFEIRFL